MSKYHVTTKRTKDTKDPEIITVQISYFVLFPSFVVNCLFRLWLRLCRAGLFATFVVIMSVSILVAGFDALGPSWWYTPFPMSWRIVCMTRICSSIQIRQPIEQVFDFITTPANWPQWHPASVSVGGDADHSLLPGEAVTENISVAGRRGLVTWLVRERIAPHRWVIDGTGKDGGRATISYTLSPHRDGTTFDRELVYAMPNPLLAVLDWLIIRSRMKADSAEALRRLKRLLESSGEID